MRERNEFFLADLIRITIQAQIGIHRPVTRRGCERPVRKNIMQEKLALDREYIVHGPSVIKDLGIILRTFSAMIGSRD